MADENTSLVRPDEEGSSSGRGCIPDWVPLAPAWKNSRAVFVLISSFSVVTMLCLVASQLMAFMVDDKVYLLEGCLRLYMIVFTSAFILCEMEIGYMVEHLASMQNWIVRGIMYSFLGFIGESESKSMLELKAVRGHLSTSLDSKIASLFTTCSSWAMVLAGAIYIVMGICRLKRLRDRSREAATEATVDV